MLGLPPIHGLGRARHPCLRLQATVVFCTLSTDSWEIFWRVLEWIGLCLGIVIAGARGDICPCAPSRPAARPGGAGPGLAPAGRGSARRRLQRALRRAAAAAGHRDPHAALQRPVLPLVDRAAARCSSPGPPSRGSGCPSRARAAAWRGHRIVVRFLNASGKQDGVAIRLMYPEQWVDAIKTHLISGLQRTRKRRAGARQHIRTDPHRHDIRRKPRARASGW